MTLRSETDRFELMQYRLADGKAIAAEYGYIQPRPYEWIFTHPSLPELRLVVGSGNGVWWQLNGEQGRSFPTLRDRLQALNGTVTA